MGVYIYTIRAKTVPVVLPTGETVRANMFSYAFKDWSLPWEAKARAQEEFRRGTFYNAADKVFRSTTKPISRYVIVGDAKDDLTDAEIWTGLKNSAWADTMPFPAERVVGFLRKDGKKYRVVEASTWWEDQASIREGKPVRRRSRVVDGKVINETEYRLPNGVWVHKLPLELAQV